MKPAPFEYHAPDTLDEALELLAEHGTEARPLAGGQSLVPTMNFRLAQPGVLVDLNRIEELVSIGEKAGGAGEDDESERGATGEGRAGGAGTIDTHDAPLRIGAMTRQRAVERSDLVRRKAPLLHAAMPWIAHAQIRNRGTIGGSLAHADPAAELPAVAVASRAVFHLRGSGGSRKVPATGFFGGLFTTALEPDELLVAVEIPTPSASTGWAFDEVARRHGDYALVGAASLLRLDDAGRCDTARTVLFNVGGAPVDAPSVGAALSGEAPTPERIAEAARATAADDIDPHADVHAGADYRRHLAGVLVRRTLEKALERAGSPGPPNG